MSKLEFMIDVCKLDCESPSCTFREISTFWYFKEKTFQKKLIIQCTKVDGCNQKKHAIMTIEEEGDD